MDGGTPDYKVNGLNFVATQAMFCPKIGDTDPWNVVNPDTETHPFHVHTNPFQITQINGVQVSPPACSPAVFEDTVMLPVLTGATAWQRRGPHAQMLGGSGAPPGAR